METNYNETQTVRMEQAEIFDIAKRLRANPYTKFQLVAPDGELMCAIISAQALDIIERVFKRNIAEAAKAPHDTLAREAVRELESLEAGETKQITVARKARAS